MKPLSFFRSFLALCLIVAMGHSTGNAQAIVDLSAGPGSGYIRIGDLQMAWGHFKSDATGPFATTTFPEPFCNATYRLLLTAFDGGSGTGRFAEGRGKTNSSFQAQTYGTPDFRSAVNGDYFAIGLWQNCE